MIIKPLSLVAILSDRFNHILIGEKSEVFAKNSEKARFCHISMKTDSPIKVLGSRTNLKQDGQEKRRKKHFLRGEF